MARKRMVSPELLTSLSVARLPIPARYAFVGLWMYLDDRGRGVDDARLIRAHLWPLDDNYTARRVTSDLALMEVEGLICRYECCETKILHSPTWHDWQKINRPTESRLCPCPKHKDGIHGTLSESSVSAHGALTPNRSEVSSREISSSDPTARANPSGSSFGSPCEHGASFGSPCIECRGLRVVNE